MTIEDCLVSVHYIPLLIYLLFIEHHSRVNNSLLCQEHPGGGREWEERKAMPLGWYSKDVMEVVRYCGLWRE